MFVNFYNSIWYLCHLARKFISIIWKNFIYCHSQKLCIFFASKLNGLISHFMSSHTSKNSLSFFCRLCFIYPLFVPYFMDIPRIELGNVLGIPMTGKSFQYFLGLQVKKPKFSVLIKFIYVFDLR